MNKKLKFRIAATTLALTASTLAFTSESSTAAGLASIVANPARSATIFIAPTAGQVAVNEVVLIAVDFPTSGTGYSNFPLLTLEHDGGTGTWAAVAGQIDKKSTSAGKYTFSYPVPVTEKVRVVAKDTPTYATVTSPDKQLTVVSSTAVLDPIVDNGSGTRAKATAHFTPVSKGRAAQLQVRTIVTKNTNEVAEDAVGSKKGPWKTIASSKQDASGNTAFTLTDPLEVSHSYRAVSGASSNEVTYAATAVTKNTGLSTIYFNSNEGASVNTRDRYFEGEFSMSASTKIPACAAVPKTKESTMKGRGNYSWSFGKKSFTLKSDKAKNLCGMGESKKWTLVANAYDKSMLRSAVAFNIGSKLTNMAWTPKATPVDLYVNGSYRGSYSLVERLSIQNADPAKPAVTNRVAIDELKADGQTTNVAPGNVNNTEPNITGGYIMEWDFRKGADQNISVGSRGYVGLKDPENDLDAAGKKTTAGVSSQQVSYINGYLDAADKALFASNFKDPAAGWRKYIDEASAVDYYIGMEMMKPVDGNMWASVYMFKPRLVPGGTNPQDDGKLRFGPMWDFDLAAGSANRAGNTVGTSGWYLRNKITTTAKQSSSTWFNRLNEDSTFRDAVEARWKVVYASLDQNQFIDTQKTLLTDSANENFRKWNVKERMSTVQVIKGSWSSEVSYLKSWMNSRRTWMNGQYK